MICSSCGSDINDNSLFCSFCGAKTNPELSGNTPAAHDESETLENKTPGNEQTVYPKADTGQHKAYNEKIVHANQEQGYYNQAPYGVPGIDGQYNNYSNPYGQQFAGSGYIPPNPVNPYGQPAYYRVPPTNPGIRVIGHRSTAGARATGAVFSILYAITPFLPFVSGMGVSMSCIQLAEYKLSNMAVLSVLVFLGSLVSLLTAILGGEGSMIVVGASGLVWFVFRFFFGISVIQEQRISIGNPYGIGFYGMGLCSLILLICGIVILNIKSSNKNQIASAGSIACPRCGCMQMIENGFCVFCGQKLYIG